MKDSILELKSEMKKKLLHQKNEFINESGVPALDCIGDRN